MHTLALCMNSVFKSGTAWQRILDHINKVTSYFNFHTKAKFLPSEKQMYDGVTSDRTKRLKHDIPTRWHSIVRTILTYLSWYHNIVDVTEDLPISENDVLSMTAWDRDTLAERITVLVEVRSVTKQLEADREETMSLEFCFLWQLKETLCVMS